MITGLYGQPVCQEYAGLSTDVKPTEDIAPNSLFLELDTGDFYFFDEDETWKKVGYAAE